MSASGATFLRVLDLEATYEDVILALRGVSLAVEEGAIVALLGPNGAGKTTTLKSISNLIRAERGCVSGGSILWRDAAIENADPSDLVQRGLVQVLEGRHCFPQLTVEENILTGGFARGLSRVEINNGLERVYRWFPRLKERRKTRSGYTSGGEQQMTAIGRALMTRPTLVLLDEPSMGLAPIVVAEIFEIIGQLNREERVTFLLAEQNANLALKYAHHAYILENGRVALSGPAAELAAREDVHEFYFGAASVGEAKSPIRHLEP
jgi:branched-chain amino acid transport system ATP-binding protein